ncbi:MAG: VCBS repeat-containing protein [Planctomycetota bacterium]
MTRLPYGNPERNVDLGVGLWAWPLPMDYDGDGDNDLVVSCPDVPYNGIYFFENISGKVTDPLFKPAVLIGKGATNIQVSYVEGTPRVLTPGVEWRDFLKGTFQRTAKLPVSKDVHKTAGRIRANQWKYADFDGDGVLDLVVGIGDWSDYGWDNAFNEKGEWTNGPLHGYVYWIRNEGTTEEPRYGNGVKVEAGGKPVDVFGMPSPNFADFDGDGDLDLLCGEFLDKFTYFENTGSRTKPVYAAGRFLESDGKPLAMDLEMIVPVAIDWEGDGDIDLVVGQEDGRVALLEHTGAVTGGMPRFNSPRFFQQQAAEVKFGALATPVGVDWDEDGDEDLISGNTAGYIGFIENLSGQSNSASETPRWAPPVLLEAGGEVLRIQAGPNGSIQGPCEAKWGYTTVSVADWDQDGTKDLLVNSIWGEVLFYRNEGSKGKPKLGAGVPVEVAWEGPPPKPAWNWWNPRGQQLVTQWRTTPFAVDWSGDRLCDLVMLDHEGYLSLLERARQGDALVLLPGKRIFVDKGGKPLRLNANPAGKSGRRKLSFADWDGDGRLDLLIDGKNVDWYRNVEGDSSQVVFEPMGPLSEHRLAGHDTSPTTVDWDGDGIRDLLIGAEDGFFYYLRNPRSVLQGE